MNTPRTRPPKRYKAKTDDAPDGGYASGIDNITISAKVGYLITYWPHIEEYMAWVFADLIGADDQSTGRLIFRSIINQKIRITVMRSLLEKSPRHKDKTPYFDELLNEFGTLNTLRNRYAHGLWYTLTRGGRVFIEEKTDTYHSFLQKREVTEAELDGVTRRIDDFKGKLWDYRRRMMQAEALLASPQKPAS